MNSSGWNISGFWKENPLPERLQQQFLELFHLVNGPELISDSIPSPDLLSAEDRKIGKIVFSEMKQWKGNRLYIITLNVGISRAGEIPWLNPMVKIP